MLVMRGARHMGKAFAPAVSGRLHSHQPRILAILHVTDEDAVFDQDGAIGRSTFVIDRKRAAPLQHCAVIDDGDAFGRQRADPQARRKPTSSSD